MWMAFETELKVYDLLFVRVDIPNLLKQDLPLTLHLPSLCPRFLPTIAAPEVSSGAAD
jgi:hypothetical protein